jgi:DNA-binding transcriptional ArsR family regulator
LRFSLHHYVSLETDEVMNSRCRTVKEQFRKNGPICERVVTLLQLISNKARFRIVCLLSRGEFCVHDIMHVVNVGKLSNISQQLAILRLGGIVQKRRDDKRVLYVIKDERVRRLIEFLCHQYLKKESKP